MPNDAGGISSIGGMPQSGHLKSLGLTGAQRLSRVGSASVTLWFRASDRHSALYQSGACTPK